MKSSFLSIPRWRDMKYLHGLLAVLLIHALIGWFLPPYLSNNEVEVMQLRFVVGLLGLCMSPIAALFYWSISSRQY